MKNYILLCILVLCTLSCKNDPKKNEEVKDEEVTTYYFIRHAEKDLSDPTNKDPELTKEGEERAEAWKDFFIDKEIDAVYATNYKRTLKTAAPIADEIDVTILNYHPSDLYDVTFAENTRGKNVVVVGHSNTTPNFANTVLKEDKAPKIDESDYGNLYIVTIKGDVKEFDKKHFD